MRGTRTDRLRRTERPTALLSAVATLLGALFICLGPAGPHHDRTGPSAPEFPTVTAYSCPDDDGGYGPLPRLSPAVLTAPPLDTPVEAGTEPPRPGPSADAGRPDRSGVRARAPDLYVLQALRT